MARIFAFGTLKRGFSLHDQGLRGAKYLGLYQTTEPFPMLIAGPWFAPMMLDQPGVGVRVSGELYEIDASRLPALDALESIGVPGNFRRLIEVRAIHGERGDQALAYMKALELAVPVHSGYLADYQDRRFVPPALRNVIPL